MESSSGSKWTSSLLEAYRRDRRKLLEFVLSETGSIREADGGGGVVPEGLDVDRLSVDSVIECVKAGGKIDFSEREYHGLSSAPLMIPSQFGDTYFLLSNPDCSGSPPRRAPPPSKIDKAPNLASTTSADQGFTRSDNAEALRNFVKQKKDISKTPATLHVKIPVLGLPPLKSGLSDDDLREVAYEVLLASIMNSGTDIQPVEDQAKDKASKFLGRLKSKKDKVPSVSPRQGRFLVLINTVRVQMQISEGLDACIKRRLAQCSARNLDRHLSIPGIASDLLTLMSRSDFFNEKSYLQWKTRKTNVLEELFYRIPYSVSSVSIEAITKISTDHGWDITKTTDDRTKVLSSILQLDLNLSSKPGQFGISGETYYWSACYHLNLRLYMRLLFGVFDILDEAQLLTEVEDILKLFRVTWPILGITERIHSALYGWVLFSQFIETDQPELLEYAMRELQKVLNTEGEDDKERLYVNSLLCSKLFNEVELKLSLVNAILFSMGFWCNDKLQDYHLHFSQNPFSFKAVINLASTVGLFTISNCFEIRFLESNFSDEGASRKVKLYVEKSIISAFERAEKNAVYDSETQRAHPLAILAKEVNLLSQKEFEVFSPVLCQWYSAAGAVSALHLHHLYGERLRPFIKAVSCLTEDVRSVFPVASLLENQLTALYNTVPEDIKLHHPFEENMFFYEIEKVSKPIVYDWVIAQHARIMEWTARASELECWESLSLQKKQAPSIVEVFRIIEETVDQVFKLNLPMDITHLMALVSVVFHSLDEYIRRMVNSLVDKNKLLPAIPALTRYEEVLIPVAKKKLVQSDEIDLDVKTKLDTLTISKLCVRLSTLQYIQKNLNTLEVGLKESWLNTQLSTDRQCGKGCVDEAHPDSCDSSEAVFAGAFDSIRDAASSAISKICEFSGARTVFWDLRDTFLCRLYHGNVEGARLESVLPLFDSILDEVCSLLDKTLRDRVVLDIFRASLEGFIFIILNGGPSRAFSDTDVALMEQDLRLFKDFFIADGEGLPCSLVDLEAKTAEDILNLYSLQTKSIIQMLMAASESISLTLDSQTKGHIHVNDAHTLIRVLCHKKDREASKFLKNHYQFPGSSEYEDGAPEESSTLSPLISDLIKRGASFRLNEKGHESIISVKKKLHRVTTDIKHGRW